MDLVNKATRLGVKKIIESIYIFDSRFTYLFILLITIISTIMFFLFEYLNRYNKYDYWKWKTRALFKSIKLSIFLILLKVVIGAILWIT